MGGNYFILRTHRKRGVRKVRGTKDEGRGSGNCFFWRNTHWGGELGSMTNDELRMTNGWELLHLRNLTEREGCEKYEVRRTKDEGVGTPVSGGTPSWEGNN